jgi:hypothetical protein
MREIGVVKRFDMEKGYGFISPNYDGHPFLGGARCSLTSFSRT